ncbi:MAG: hypothetical protein ACTSQJ_12680 [Promethearchaeota archaeon]
MTNNHNYSFFGQTTGLTIQSTSNEESFIFIRCIKKKPNGEWEKPSNGEGKVIKFSLEEMVMILHVLDRTINNWSSYHTYKDNKTQISISWENGDLNTNRLWINIGNYSKMLTFAQSEILRLLLRHVLKEKIKFSTIVKKNSKAINNQNINGSSYNRNFNRRVFNSYSGEINYNRNVNKKNEPMPLNNRSNDNGKTSVEGFIKSETEKALLIVLKNGKEIWIPKSTIHSNYTANKNLNQMFLIDSWIFKKHNL